MHKSVYGPIGRSRTTRLAAGTQRGSVTLEFVILLPFLIMVLVGIFDLSLMMYDKAALTSAARVAARAGTVISVPPLSTSRIAAIAVSNASGSLISGGTNNPPTATATEQTDATSGNTLKVTLSYTYSGLLLGSAFSALTGPIMLSASAVMINQ
ncbi:TadE family protein [Caballeronia hypogeia]|uniref:TadE family protein n=1 Tax=Caballeronia hypogeia TaxID=1777140 RepID=A0A158CYY2_9BURK|nr:TadE/TadG family type IV pilus assembly protein [Caballeronia hypogeia]SAK86827.1 TadE family protein [Caballeronia hypogeia]